MKVWMMLNDDIEDVSFESKVFNEVMQETKMTDAERAEVVSVLDKILAVYNELENYDNAKVAKAVRKKMTSETHMISLVPYFKKAVDENVSDKLTGDFMVELFGNGVLVSEEYAEACKGGSAKNVNIKRRDSEIEKAWDKFFDADSDDEVRNNGIVDNFAMNEPEEIDL